MSYYDGGGIMSSMVYGVDTYPESLPYARRKRAYWAKWGQEMKEFQKEATKHKDYETAKFFKAEFNECKMLERCFDYVVKYCECHPDYTYWRHEKVSKEMRSILSRCFDNTFDLIEPDGEML